VGNMKKAKVETEPLEEIELLDSMLTEEEYEKHIKQRVKIK
jgi:hypothetical protein